MDINHEKHVVLGTGPLGMAVIEALASQGKQVVSVNRSGEADLPAGVSSQKADLYDEAATLDALTGASYAYQCAQPAYHRWLDQFLPLQRNIVKACKATGARLVVGENMYMYGQVDRPLTEDMPYRAETSKGRLRAQMAEELLNAHASGDIQVTIARGSDFYGPYVLGSSMGDRVFAPILQGKAASITGDPDLPHTHTYIKDFGRAMALLADKPEAYGQAWHVPNPPTITQRELVEIAFSLVGRAPEIKSMGRLMMRIGGLFIPQAREMVEMMYEFENAFIVDSAKFERHFTLQPTPYRQAIYETLLWYRDYLRIKEEAVTEPIHVQQSGVR